MSNSNKLNTILLLQSIAVKAKDISKNVQKVFDAGKDENQWNAYCLKTGEHFDLPKGMTVIPCSMFSGHKNLKTVNIPETVTTIETDAFASCSNLGVRQIPNSVVLIFGGAFAFCSSNSTAVMPASIYEIGGMAFGYNDGIEEITFVKTSSQSGTPDYIEISAFNGCENLKTINVPWSEGQVSGAPWGAKNATINYNYWDNIPDVFHFPKGFVKIPDYLFYDTTATTAKEIYLGDECKEIGECSFYKAQKLETIHFPDGLTTIGKYAFRHCRALRFFELPDSIKSIEQGAFENVPAPLSKLPKNLKEIAKNAFANNTSLTELTFLGTPSIVHSTAFSGCTNLVEINVPWSEGDVAGAPWGAPNATVYYNYVPEEGGD